MVEGSGVEMPLVMTTTVGCEPPPPQVRNSRKLTLVRLLFEIGLFPVLIEYHRCMKLRLATASDVALLRYWDTKPHVIAASGKDHFVDWDFELSRSPDWRKLLVAEFEGRPVGMIEIIDPAQEETHYWGEVTADLRAIDIWIGEESDLGRGYGTQMMHLALERCFGESAVAAILIDPLANNTRAHRFYERLGFKCVDRRMFGKEDCFVHRLERQYWNSMFEDAN